MSQDPRGQNTIDSELQACSGYAKAVWQRISRSSEKQASQALSKLRSEHWRSSWGDHSAHADKGITSNNFRTTKDCMTAGLPWTIFRNDIEYNADDPTNSRCVIREGQWARNTCKCSDFAAFASRLPSPLLHVLKTSKVQPNRKIASMRSQN